MDQNINKLTSLIESLIFVHGEPMKIGKIAEIIGVDQGDVEQCLGILKDRLDREDSGISLMTFDGNASLITKPEFVSVIQKMVKEEIDSPLTPASLETLSIIAYVGPISRAGIEYIRGVNSSFILRSLLIRGLIVKETGLDKGRVLYKVTFDFLKHVGVSSAEQLPEFENYKGILNNLLNPTESAGDDNKK